MRQVYTLGMTGLLLLLCGASPIAFAEDTPGATAAVPQPADQPPDTNPPAAAAESTAPAPAVSPQSAPAVPEKSVPHETVPTATFVKPPSANATSGGDREKGPTGNKNNNRPDHSQPSQSQNHNNHQNGRPGGNNNWHGSNTNHYRPPARIVYVYPRTYYPVTTYVQTSPNYPDGYAATFKIGDYLPNDREWLTLPDYVYYSLPEPRAGEQWVYNGRDVVLINNTTAKIQAAMVLAASIP